MNTLLGFPAGRFLNQINEGDGSPGSGAPEAPDFKGLFFVYLYGAYEHCIVDGFREALIAANAHGLADVEVRPELAGLAFNRWFDSLESARCAQPVAETDDCHENPLEVPRHLIGMFSFAADAVVDPF